MIIKAAQHIYGNVEQEQSPHKVGGFQTLFYTTSGLSEAESEEIEERLVYHHSETNPVKWLFFPLSGEKVVLTRIVPLTDIDKFGREGSYLAHSVILSKEEFSKVKSNPFIVFRLVGDRFLSSTSAALDKGDLKTANINEMTLEIREKNLETMEREMTEEMQSWDPGELKKMAYYTIHYRELKDKRETLVFSGTREQITAALEMAFMFVPPELRLHCTFDTYFYGCSLVRNYFWTTGYPDTSGMPPHLPLIDAAERKVTAALPADVSPYEEWIYDCILHRQFYDIPLYNSTALVFQEFLADQSVNEKKIRSALVNIPDAFFKQITNLNGLRVHLTPKIQKRLEEAVGKKLSQRLMERVLTYSINQPKRLFYILLDGFDLSQLADELYKTYKDNITGKPGKQEIRELQSLLEKAPHEELEALVTDWLEKSKDQRPVKNFLNRLMPFGKKD